MTHERQTSVIRCEKECSEHVAVGNGQRNFQKVNAVQLPQGSTPTLLPTPTPICGHWESRKHWHVGPILACTHACRMRIIVNVCVTTSTFVIYGNQNKYMYHDCISFAAAQSYRCILSRHVCCSLSTL